MAWADDLETVVSRTGVERFRWLTSEDNPDAHGRERYRVQMVEMALQPAQERPAAPTAPAYPPFAEQVGNALKAGLKFLTSGCKITDQAEHDRRLSICRAPCEFWDKAQGRCVKCGCVDEWKAWVDSQKCPMNYWEVKP